MNRPLDLIVVGAGPVGLAVALGVARQGRSVLVLEKEAATAEHSRAPAIGPRTQEVLAGLGVIDRFLADGIALHAVTLHDVDRGRPLLTIRSQSSPAPRPTRSSSSCRSRAASGCSSPRWASRRRPRCGSRPR